MTTTDLTRALTALYDEYLASQQRARRANLASYPTSAQRLLLDQLLCIRPPGVFPPGIQSAVERILAREAEAREVIDARNLPTYPADPANSTPHTISLFRGDLTLLTHAALVNPANTRMLGCFQPTHKCLDNVIHARAGPGVRLECAKIMAARGVEDLEVGEPIFTGAGLLDSPGIVHVAGPQLARGAQPTDQERQDLRRAYSRSLDLVAEAGIMHVAFPCISTGIFAFPLLEATEQELVAVRDWMDRNPQEMHVTFVLWTAKDEAAYLSTIPQVFPHLSGIIKVHKAGVPDRVKEWVRSASSVIVHAGAGLSADAVHPTLGLGLDYTSSELFSTLYPGLRREGLGCLYHTIGHEWSDRLVQWGFIFAHAHTVLSWGETPVYSHLKRLVSGKEYTVLTSNADNLFLQSGFDEDRICTRQGSYARFQCLRPCSPTSYFPVDEWVARAIPHLDLKDPRVPAALADELIPMCPNCGGEVFLNVRGGDWFLETPHEEAEERYAEAVERMVESAREKGGIVLVLELGAGFNTPTVIRLPTERLARFPEVRVVRVNPNAPEFEDELGREVAAGLRMSADEFLREVLETIEV